MLERQPVFVKQFPAEDNAWVESMTDFYERLGSSGYFPEVYAMVLNSNPKGESSFLMERVEGFTLADTPPEFDDYKFSVRFAKDLRDFFLGFYEAGFVQEDNHPDNIMFDINKKRFVFVDGAGIFEVTRENYTMKELVNNFSVALISVYLGRLYWLLTDECGLEEFEDEESRGLALVILNRARLLNKINPQVREFIIKGINRGTCPENFDELFAV